MAETPFIEWLGTSCFSFLEGVTPPDGLVEAAAGLGYQGIALGDRMGLYGVVQGLAGFEGLQNKGDFFYAPGIRLHFDSAEPLFIYPLHKRAYADLCKYLSERALAGMEFGQKGLNPLSWKDFFNKFLKRFASLKDDFILIHSTQDDSYTMYLHIVDFLILN